MKKLIVMLTLLLSLLGVVGYAGATTLDFDSYDEGTIISTSGFFSDVAFSSDYDLFVTAASGQLQAELSGKAVRTTTKFTHPNPFVGIFSISGVNSVSVTLGDVNADQDNLFLIAFDSNNNIIDSDSYLWPVDAKGGVNLTVMGTNIAYVKFGSTGTSPNSVYFDNFTYTSVPEPTTILLIGFGLLGLAGLRRKIKK